jgi:hypothetical protein
MLMVAAIAAIADHGDINAVLALHGHLHLTPGMEKAAAGCCLTLGASMAALQQVAPVFSCSAPTCVHPLLRPGPCRMHAGPSASRPGCTVALVS